MIITTKEIELKLRKDFPSVYKRFGNFIDSGYIWDTIIDVINDSTLMNHIIYANDVLLIPPVRCHGSHSILQQMYGKRNDRPLRKNCR